MDVGELRVGAYTHTGRILGYCPHCALYHHSELAAQLCAVLSVATNPRTEAIAWRALKAAVAMEDDESTPPASQPLAAIDPSRNTTTAAGLAAVA